MSDSGPTPPRFDAFVAWNPEDGQDAGTDGKSAPRLHYKKSRNGCSQCKSRRVKCDEVHPTCGNCQRYGADCVYPVQVVKSNDKTRKASTAGSTPEARISSSPAPADLIPPDRHLLELKLLHRYMSETAVTLTCFADNEAEQKYYWTIALPQLAFRHEALLKSVFAVSAFHWSKIEPESVDAQDAFKTYFGQTIVGHRDDVATLSKENADAVCLTSTIIRLCAFVTLSTRSLEPYEGPYSWLHMTNASGKVWSTSWDWIRIDATSISASFFRATPALADRATLFDPTNKKGMDYLMESNREEDAATWTIEIGDAYESTVAYIGGVRIAIAAMARPVDIFRRLVAFPMYLKKEFTELVREGRPRALAILCHFFALLTELKGYWWIAGTGEREVRAIAKALPQNWKDLVAWPLRVVEDPTILLGADIVQDLNAFPPLALGFYDGYIENLEALNIA